MSLRRFLLLTLGLSLISLLSVSMLFSYHNATHQLEEVFDAELAQHAKVLARTINNDAATETQIIESWHQGQEVTEDMEEALGEGAESDQTGHAYENKLAFQIWQQQRLRQRSATAPDSPLAALSPGYYDAKLHGHSWRVFVLRVSSDTHIIVAHRDDVRSELAREIAINLILPAIALLPLLLLIILYVIRRATAPLRTLANELQSRTPEQLNPIAVNNTPAEVLPLVQALNQMMEQVQHSFAQQKRFIADAAHELRTPLAALQIHAENAQNSNGAEQRQSLAQLRLGVERSSHLLEQLLQLSRLEHRKANDFSPLSIAQAIERVLRDLTVVAQKRQQTIVTSIKIDAQVNSTSNILQLVFRNLVDNALRYSPDGSAVMIELDRNANDAVITIADNGCGIAPELRERVFEPFFRELGNHSTGTGLGLSIVREAIAQMKGRIELLANQPQGLLVRVYLPLL